MNLTNEDVGKIYLFGDGTLLKFRGVSILGDHVIWQFYLLDGRLPVYHAIDTNMHSIGDMVRLKSVDIQIYDTSEAEKLIAEENRAYKLHGDL